MILCRKPVIILLADDDSGAAQSAGEAPWESGPANDHRLILLHELVRVPAESV